MSMFQRYAMYLIKFFVFGLLITGCSFRGYSPPTGELFGNSPLYVERIAIITSMPNESKNKVGVPISNQLVNNFKKNGVQVWSKVKQLNPLALQSDLNFSEARQFNPNVYLVIRSGASTWVRGSLSSFSLVVGFDLYDEKGQGIWRGSTTLTSLRDMDTLSEKIAQDLVDKLLKDHVIVLDTSRRKP